MFNEVGKVWFLLLLKMPSPTWFTHRKLIVSFYSPNLYRGAAGNGNLPIFLCFLIWIFGDVSSVDCGGENAEIKVNFSMICTEIKQNYLPYNICIDHITPHAVYHLFSPDNLTIVLNSNDEHQLFKHGVKCKEQNFLPTLTLFPLWHLFFTWWTPRPNFYLMDTST